MESVMCFWIIFSLCSLRMRTGWSSKIIYMCSWPVSSLASHICLAEWGTMKQPETVLYNSKVGGVANGQAPTPSFCQSLQPAALAGDAIRFQLSELECSNSLKHCFREKRKKPKSWYKSRLPFTCCCFFTLSTKWEGKGNLKLTSFSFLSLPYTMVCNLHPACCSCWKWRVVVHAGNTCSTPFHSKQGFWKYFFGLMVYGWLWLQCFNFLFLHPFSWLYVQKYI